MGVYRRLYAFGRGCSASNLGGLSRSSRLHRMLAEELAVGASNRINWCVLGRDSSSAAGYAVLESQFGTADS